MHRKIRLISLIRCRFKGWESSVKYIIVNIYGRNRVARRRESAGADAGQMGALGFLASPSVARPEVERVVDLKGGKVQFH